MCRERACTSCVQIVSVCHWRQGGKGTETAGRPTGCAQLQEVRSNALICCSQGIEQGSATGSECDNVRRCKDVCRVQRGPPSAQTEPSMRTHQFLAEDMQLCTQSGGNGSYARKLIHEACCRNPQRCRLKGNVSFVEAAEAAGNYVGLNSRQHPALRPLSTQQVADVTELLEHHSITNSGCQGAAPPAVTPQAFLMNVPCMRG